MKTFYKSLMFGAFVAALKFFLWNYGFTFWELGLVSVSGLIAGIFFILASIFRSALFDYKQADKSICTISAKICSMNDININAAANKDSLYDPSHLSQQLISTLKIIKKYLQGKTTFDKLDQTISELNEFTLVLDSSISSSKVSRFQQYQDHLREHISYLMYGMSLQFPKVGYTFLHFFIFSLLVLQIFSHTQNMLLELVFIFSLASVLIFFADLVRDLDRPFNRKKAAFKVDLTPLEKAVKSIQRHSQ